jgi:hypothetical protein
MQITKKVNKFKKNWRKVKTIRRKIKTKPTHFTILRYNICISFIKGKISYKISQFGYIKNIH